MRLVDVKRCILTNEGKVVAYYGETGYTETGALLQQVQTRRGYVRGRNESTSYGGTTLILL